MAVRQPIYGTMDGVATVARKLAVAVKQNLKTTLRWQIRGDDRNPIDLQFYGFVNPSTETSSSSSSSSSLPISDSRSIQLALCEVFNTESESLYTSVGSIVDAFNGEVQAAVPMTAVGKPGVYNLEWRVFDNQGDLCEVDTGYLFVEPSLGAPSSLPGPPDVATIRQALRDSGPEDNYLLNASEFDVGEICFAVEYAVRIWNETLAFMHHNYTTASFPYRQQWLQAIIGQLLQVAAHNYERNFQQYSSAGINMNDKAKGQPYLQKGILLLNEYKKWVQLRKQSINLEGCYGGTSEDY